LVAQQEPPVGNDAGHPASGSIAREERVPSGHVVPGGAASEAEAS
jgi:hypothetical protein